MLVLANNDRSNLKVTIICLIQRKKKTWAKQFNFLPSDLCLKDTTVLVFFSDFFLILKEYM